MQKVLNKTCVFEILAKTFLFDFMCIVQYMFIVVVSIYIYVCTYLISFIAATRRATFSSEIAQYKENNFTVYYK